MLDIYGAWRKNRIRVAFTAGMVLLSVRFVVAVEPTAGELERLKLLPSKGFFTVNNANVIMRGELSDPLNLKTLSVKGRWAQISPDGTLLAYWRQGANGQNCSLLVSNADGTDERLVVAAAKYMNRIEWTESSKQLIFCGGDTNSGNAQGPNNGSETGRVYLVDIILKKATVIKDFEGSNLGKSFITDADYNRGVLLYRKSTDVYVSESGSGSGSGTDFLFHKTGCDVSLSPSGNKAVVNHTGHMSFNIYTKTSSSWKTRDSTAISTVGSQDIFFSNSDDWGILHQAGTTSFNLRDLFVFRLSTKSLIRITFLAKTYSIGSLHISDASAARISGPDHGYAITPNVTRKANGERYNILGKRDFAPGIPGKAQGAPSVLISEKGDAIMRGVSW